MLSPLEFKSSGELQHAGGVSQIAVREPGASNRTNVPARKAGN
jgi:hypothetical protein